MTTYDSIVLGVGGVGSSVLYHLAARGSRVLGIDRFSPPHDRGSSHGDSRVIRLAYLEHPAYVPLLQRAYHLWTELGQRTGRDLYQETGLLYIGAEDSGAVPALLRCASEHDLELERLEPVETMRRFPAFHCPAEMIGVYEKTAGYLRLEDSIRSHIEEAKRLGAALHDNETVVSWNSDAHGVTVTTNKDRYQADRLILAPGAWAPDLLRGLGVDFEIRRKETFWFEPPSPEFTQESGCPCFFVESRASLFYGIPSYDGGGLKVSEHSGGTPVENPMLLDRDRQPEDRRRIDVFLAGHLPNMTRKLIKHSVCMYTMTPDESFIVDRHPAHERVYFAAGLSGHGYKFASVLGEILARWATEGSPGENIEFLSLDRSGLRAL